MQIEMRDCHRFSTRVLIWGAIVSLYLANPTGAGAQAQGPKDVRSLAEEISKAAPFGGVAPVVPGDPAAGGAKGAQSGPGAGIPIVVEPDSVKNRAPAAQSSRARNGAAVLPAEPGNNGAAAVQTNAARSSDATAQDDPARNGAVMIQEDSGAEAAGPAQGAGGWPAQVGVGFDLSDPGAQAPEPAGPSLADLPPLSISNVYTPVLASALSSPVPFRGTDGSVHLAYELQVTNASGTDVAIESLSVLDPLNSDAVLLAMSADEVGANLFLPVVKVQPNVLAPAQSGLVWINLPLPAGVHAPPALDHLITVSAKEPQGLIASKSIERVARVPVDLRGAITIGPPLEGDRWIAVSGCCNSYHRFSALPVNGEWVMAERFAVDWVRVDDHDRLVTGNPKKNESYPQFGKKFFAVANGVVVKAQDGQRDEVPGDLPSVMTTESMGGNCVMVDLGNGLTAYYAHAKKGSILVREGEKVYRGQPLGLIGNSGDSQAPHLHFQLMFGRLARGSDGAPFTIDAFNLKGRAISEDDLATQLNNPGEPLRFEPVEGIGKRFDEMPADLSYIEFPGIAPQGEKAKAAR